MAKKGHFQIACSKYFDSVHNADFGLGINHPNQYFEESQKLLKGEIKIEPNSSQIKPNPVKKEKIDIEEMDFENEEWNNLKNQ